MARPFLATHESGRLAVTFCKHAFAMERISLSVAPVLTRFYGWHLSRHSRRWKLTAHFVAMVELDGLTLHALAVWAKGLHVPDGCWQSSVAGTQPWDSQHVPSNQLF
eukprot:1149730-Pelagomonas_calceolata.AAC.2